MARHSLRMLWIAWLFFRIACAMRENAHAGLLHSMSAFDNLSANVSANISANGTLRAVANATVEDMLKEMAQQQAKSELQPFPDDPFKDDPWFQKRRDPHYDPFKDDPFFEKNRNDPFNNRNKDPFNNRNSPSPSPPSSDHSWSGHDHHYHRAAAAGLGVIAIFWIFWAGLFCCICCVPTCILCRGHFKARALRAKLEHLQLKHPPHDQRQPVNMLSDGMMRLAQEDRILIREKVNMAQELSGHVLGYSVQTANSFEVISVVGGGEHVLNCREVQDLQAMLGMNLAGGLQALGVEGAGHWAGRDKAPFRMLVGLPPAANPMETGKIQVTVPEGVSSGQQIQVTTPTGEQLLVAVPPGVAPGQTMEVTLPGKQNSGPSMQQVMTGLVPGCAANNDAPFLYLDRPFAIDCCCLNRPKVDVFDVRGTATVKLGIISDPFAWMDMTFGIHIGPNAQESDPPALIARGAACQPGAVCKLCGVCCGRTCREAYLEVVDPNDKDRTVAFITKGWAGGAQEIFTSANSFYVDFGEVKDPACKALLLATALFLNYRFFEGRAGSTQSSSN